MKKVICVLLLIGIGFMLAGGFLVAQGESKQPDSRTTVAAGEGKTSSSGMTFWQIMAAGGLSMVAIALFSIAMVAIIAERFVNANPKKLLPSDLIDEVNALAKEKKFEEASALCEKRPCLISNMFKTVLEKWKRGHKVVVQIVEEAGAKEAAIMQQRIIYLSVTAVITPMIGLLGTVIGMIQAFNVIAFQGGAGKPTLLAAGISKALVTTAAGLIVAVPAMIFFYYFKVNIQNLMARVETIMEDFVDIVFPAKPGQSE